MPNTFLGNVVVHLVGFVEPITEAFETHDSFSRFLLRFGWEATGSMPSQYQNVKSAVADLVALHKNFEQGQNSTEKDVLEIVNAFKNVYNVIKNLNTAPSGVDSNTYISEFPGQFFDSLVENYLSRYHPDIYNILTLLSIIQYEFINGTTTRLPYKKVSIDYSKILDIVKSPQSLLKTSLGWNTADYDFSFLATALINFLSAIRKPAIYQQTDYDDIVLYENEFGVGKTYPSKLTLWPLTLPVNNSYEQIVLQLTESIGSSPSDSGFIVRFDIPSNIDTEISIGNNYTFHASASSIGGNNYGLLITPSTVQFKNLTQSSSSISDKFKIGFVYKPEQPKVLLGKPQGTSLTLKSAGIAFEIAQADTSFEFIAQADLSGLQFVIDPADGDGFISKIMGGSPRTVSLPVIVSWSSKSGIHFKGSGAFEVTVAPHVQIGPVKFEQLILALKAVDQQPLKVEVGANITAKLGMFSVVVDNIGMGLAFSPEEGNAGPFGIDIGFKSPNGIGLQFNLKKVSGGGYLYIDKDKGRYCGAIEVNVFDKLHVSAVGIITTKNPDGSNGYSLIVVLSVEFPVGIPLPFGFSLKGIGGIVGTNRTINADSILLGVKSGSLDSVMFPRNVVENIQTIITDLEQFFPYKEDRYVLGLFFFLKWGVGVKLVDIKFGIVVSIPEPVKIAILGTLKVALPSKEAPVLQLNVAFAGIIDFENKYLAFDASIYDSKLLFLSLAGDMAVRVYWGQHKELIISVGGFHPAYHAASYLGLSSMQRLKISILDTSLLRISVATYFAVTSNTVQLGVSADLKLSVAMLSIVGWASFDVLFQFNPFRFIAALKAGMAVLWGERELLCISLDFLLEGPAPWHAVGKAKFKALGIKFSPKFDITWGDKPNTTVPSIDVSPKLEEALRDDENWQTKLPDNKEPLVRFLPAATGNLIFNPFGELIIVQKVLPFNILIERYGGQKVNDSGKYGIYEVTIDGQLTSKTDERENFAPAQYLNMSDDKKLEAASFEYLPCGVNVKWSQNAFMVGDYIIKDLEYETVIIDKSDRTPIAKAAIDSKMVNNFAKGGLISSNPISISNSTTLDSPIVNVTLKQEGYKAVSKDSLNNLSSQVGTSSGASMAEALTIADNIIKVNPSLAGTLEFIPA